MPMAGFPYHQLESYLGKLIAAGLRVAICDQVEDPQAGQGTGPPRSDAHRHARHGHRRRPARSAREQLSGGDRAAGRPVGLAWVELSTGRFQAACFPPERLADRTGPDRSGRMPAGRRRPTAARTCSDRAAARHAAARLGVRARSRATESLTQAFRHGEPRRLRLRRRAATTRRSARPGRSSTIWTKRKRASLAHIDRLDSLSHRARRWRSTKRPAAVWKSRARCAKAAAKARCLAVLDRTVTAMGSRLLADWLANPLTDVAAIDERLDAVAELVADARLGRRLARAAATASTTSSGCWPA